MASSKKGKAAPAPGPAPAAVRAPALTAVPDPIGGDDELVQPQPAKAVALTTADRERLVLVLQRAGHFPRPVGKYGNRMLRTETTHGAEFRDGLPEGYVERVVVNPNGKRRVLVGRGPWQPADGWRLVSEARSAIDERAEAVGGLRIELEAVVRPLLRGSKLPMPEAWDQVLADDVLDAVTVGDALAALDAGQHRGAGQPMAKTPIDVAQDVVCQDIRRALSKNNRLLDGLVKDCKPASRRTVTSRLSLLREAGQVEQSGNRGHYRLTEAGAEQQRLD